MKDCYVVVRCKRAFAAVTADDNIWLQKNICQKKLKTFQNSWKKMIAKRNIFLSFLQIQWHFLNRL